MKHMLTPNIYFHNVKKKHNKDTIITIIDTNSFIVIMITEKKINFK